MFRNQKKISLGDTIVFLLVLVNAAVVETGFTVDKEWYALLLVTVPLLLIILLLSHRKML